MKFKRFALLFPVLLLLSCSDSGDGPTGGDDGALKISVSAADAIEGQAITVTVSLTAVSTSDVIYIYATSNGTATAGSDYTAASQMDTIMAGMTSTTVSISTTNDATLETGENFSFTISTPVNATLGTASALMTIWDNDGTSFSGAVMPLIASTCATTGCHGTGWNSGGMTLGSASYNSVVNASGVNGPAVIKGNASMSNLYRKTTDTWPFGDRMPQGGSLTLTDQNKLRDWINQGAQPN